MIPKSSKFPTRTQFLTFRTQSKQVITPHLRIMFYPHSPSRLSVIVPKKVSKLATTRNHFKRLVYDSVWEITNDKNLDCVVMFKPLPLQKSFAAQQQIISELKFLIPNS